MLKKIRRMLALQGLMWSAALWFGWKKRDAIERSVRAARAAWDEAGNEASDPAGSGPDVMVVVLPDSGSSGDAPPSEPEAARPGF